MLVDLNRQEINIVIISCCFWQDVSIKRQCRGTPYIGITVDLYECKGCIPCLWTHDTVKTYSTYQPGWLVRFFFWNYTRQEKSAQVTHKAQHYDGNTLHTVHWEACHQSQLYCICCHGRLVAIIIRRGQQKCIFWHLPNKQVKGIK